MKLPHLDGIYEKGRFKPPHPRVGIEGIWNGLNIKFQHQTTLPWHSLRSTSH